LSKEEKYILINYLSMNGNEERFNKNTFLNVYNNNINPSDFE
jgi:hypothetical protein